MIELAVHDIAQWIEIIRSLGAVGIALYAAIFVVATVAFVPASMLTALAGFLYGPMWGTLLISPAGLLSATVAFALGRSLLRPRVKRHLANSPKSAAVDRAIASGGFRIVFLLRLASIVPFAPLSYGLGASRIARRDFMLATWFGLLPGTFLYAYLGSLAADVAQIISGEVTTSRSTQVMTWAGLVVALIALLTIARYARKAINQALVQPFSNQE
ncbi:TVP38/TMEM64 family protein [Pseudomonas sp. B21-010]|uniref:TVP38/TMEM64 family protein n=1 Tax=Pseudomonas sp. B21-010 TaxID=2895471 RepID=UPI00215F0B7F|nr:TVP38/TMEM64 family protein [Pseudomonas sp. B21-010]UVM63573.1 TVP38/TMEM64 family protein [Pseudomonas sp. B21-010]